MTKKEFMQLDEKSRFDWMIERGWKADEKGQVWSHKGKPVGCVNKVKGYVEIGISFKDGMKTIKTHRFLWYFMTGEVPEQVDHINRVKHDNRLFNLRSVTDQQNKFNTKAKGYSIHKPTGKQAARIQVNRKKIHLGYHDTEEQAAAAYQAAKQKYHQIQ
jgi:hypothetical protein